MTFPTVRSTANTEFSSTTTTWDVNLPASVESGDLLMVFVSSDGGTDVTFTWDNISHGTWTELYDTFQGSGVRAICRVKVADGTEDSGVLNLVASQAETGVAFSVAIRDWKGDLSGVTAGTPVLETTANPNPPSVTAAGGSGKNLFLAPLMHEGDGVATAFPTSYDDNQTTFAAGGQNGASFSFCSRELSSATDNPSAYTVDINEDNVVNTIVIEPAPAPAPPPPPPPAGILVSVSLAVPSDKIIPPNRYDPWVDENRRPILRLGSVIEALVDAANDFKATPINEITDDYRFIQSDAGGVVRYTGNTNITITIPSSTEVGFDVGTQIQIENDGTAVVFVNITTDTLTSSAGLGTGSRSIAADGDARLFLVALTNWKISGNQIT